MRPRILIGAALALACLGAGPLQAAAAPQRGYASYYAHYHEGMRTASGERFHMHALTAAEMRPGGGRRGPSTNLANGRHVVVRINDRGPYVRGRVLDVSYAAAQRLGLLSSGVARVRLRVV